MELLSALGLLERVAIVHTHAMPERITDLDTLAADLLPQGDILTGILIYGFTSGDFFAEGARLLNMPWGMVSLVDLYVGFALFSCWFVFREKALVPSVIWVILMMVLGFWAGALYTYTALQTSGGDWKRFWYGKRSI